MPGRWHDPHCLTLSATFPGGRPPKRESSRIAVAELALDDDQGHALVCHLDRMCVTELMRVKPAPHARGSCRPAQLRACGRR
jgi:hypothetical protein